MHTCNWTTPADDRLVRQVRGHGRGVPRGSHGAAAAGHGRVRPRAAHLPPIQPRVAHHLPRQRGLAGTQRHRLIYSLLPHPTLLICAHCLHLVRERPALDIACTRATPSTEVPVQCRCCMPSTTEHTPLDQRCISRSMTARTASSAQPFSPACQLVGLRAAHLHAAHTPAPQRTVHMAGCTFHPQDVTAASGGRAAVALDLDGAIRSQSHLNTHPCLSSPHAPGRDGRQRWQCHGGPGPGHHNMPQHKQLFAEPPFLRT